MCLLGSWRAHFQKTWPMFDVVLYEPEIPGNTGNVIRLCANTGARLHLVKPLGFSLNDRELKRAGLDYHEYASLRLHQDWKTCLAHFSDRTLYALTTKASRAYADARLQSDDVFVFGPETRGLPGEVLSAFSSAHKLRLPMVTGSRSLNLSNAVAALLYEAWRQSQFLGGS